MKYITFLCSILLFSCKSQQISNNSTQKELTYLALGDSYTIGESVAENERFPVQLATKLKNAGIEVASPIIVARTGWTTDELKLGIEKANIGSQNYDFVSLLIGVNNQYRSRDVEVFRKEFVGLLDDAIRFAGNNPKRVFVVSIPDWGVTPFGKQSGRKDVSEKIDLFNAVKKEETLKKGILFVDITPISRVATTDLTLVADDGLHPSGKMYGLWADKIMVDLVGKLK